MLAIGVGCVQAGGVEGVGKHTIIANRHATGDAKETSRLMWMCWTDGRLVLSPASDNFGSSGGWMEAMLEEGTAFGMTTLTTLLAVEDAALFTPDCGWSSTLRGGGGGGRTLTYSGTTNRQWVHVEGVWFVTQLADGNALSGRVVGAESACYDLVSNQLSKYTLESTIAR